MGALKAGSITQKQKEMIATLEAKEKITAKQQITLDDLITKRDAPPELPETAKTYCKDWLKEQLYERRKEISSKPMRKGNLAEDDSIALIGEYINNPLLFKNEEYLENEWMGGTYDTKTEDTVIDAKSSWDFQTFPLFDDKLNVDYEWQVRAYMELTGLSKAKVIYCLVDLPEEMRNDEVRSLMFGGMDEEDARNKVESYHTYGNLPINLRVKSYDVAHDQEKINSVKARVELCRTYIKEVIKAMK
jgi:hypothetical protein